MSGLSVLSYFDAPPINENNSLVARRRVHRFKRLEKAALLLSKTRRKYRRD